MSATIIVEDGTGKTDSNSYVSEADLATYGTNRGVTISGTAADLLIKAMDYLEDQNFLGTIASDTQALQWPRYNVVIDTYYVDSDEIPQLLIDAQCETALAIDAGTDPLQNVGRAKSKTTVGPITVEYEKGTREYTEVQRIDAKLRKLLASQGSGAKVIRA